METCPVADHTVEPRPQSVVFGLLSLRERWGLSIRGWILVLFSGLGAALAFVGTVHPFLSIQRRVPAEYLVVEGWVADYALEVAGKEMETDSYRKLLTTGGPLPKGSYLLSYRTFAEVAAATLLQLGVKEDRLEAVPAPAVNTDRTRASALAVREWFQQHALQPQAVNVVTIGAHARRTRLTYAQVLGQKVQVGVIMVDPSEYEPDRWWRYSAGIKSVIGELTGYFYARLIPAN